MNLGTEVKNQGMLHKFEEINTTQEIKVTNISRLIDFIVPGFVEIERLSGSPKAPPSARQNACEDSTAHVQEGHRLARGMIICYFWIFFSIKVDFQIYGVGFFVFKKIQK